MKEKEKETERREKKGGGERHGRAQNVSCFNLPLLSFGSKVTNKAFWITFEKM